MFAQAVVSSTLSLPLSHAARQRFAIKPQIGVAELRSRRNGDRHDVWFTRWSESDRQSILCPARHLTLELVGSEPHAIESHILRWRQLQCRRENARHG